MKRRAMLVAALVALSAVGCVRIHSGQAGVKWKMFGGTDLERVYGEGLHVVPPWDRMYVYSVRIQDRKERLNLLASNGLPVKIEASIRYHPLKDELALLHTQVEPPYFETMVGPIVRSEAREVAGRYTPEQIYSTKREEMQEAIYVAVNKALEGHHIVVEKILIRDVELPKNIQDAIAEKLEEEQKALKMEFVLDRERREAERKEIEANGIAKFQTIVSKGISPMLLTWKGIEATQQLAESPNAKVIVIGSSESGLPLILGGAN